MKNKKDKRELEILEMIFSNENLVIEKSEQPDFLLKYNTGNLIGVEITELYFDGTSARLKNKNGYIDDLITHSRFIHKDDKRQLKINKIEYFPKSQLGSSVKMNALFLPKYTFSDYRTAFFKRLKDKNNRIQKYNMSVQQCNLVIYDCENKLNNTELRSFSKYLFSNEILNEIKNSRFTEIYFITKIQEISYYIQLKAYYLLNQAYILHDYIRKNKLKNKLISLNIDFEDVYAEVLIRVGTKKFAMLYMKALKLFILEDVVLD